RRDRCKARDAAGGRHHPSAAERSDRRRGKSARLRPRSNAGVPRSGSGAPQGSRARELLVHQILPRRAAGIPALIKRNTALLALSQAFVGAGTQLAYGIGPLMIVAVTGSASLAGLTVGLFGVSRFLVSYPTGRITDTYGRKPGILFGQALALGGTMIAGLGMIWHSIAGVCLGMVIFTMGVSAAQQLRVAAADMYPPRMRGMAL